MPAGSACIPSSALPGAGGGASPAVRRRGHFGVRWLATALAAPNRPNAESSAFATDGNRPSQSGGKPPHSKMRHRRSMPPRTQRPQAPPAYHARVPLLLPWSIPKKCASFPACLHSPGCCPRQSAAHRIGRHAGEQCVVLLPKTSGPIRGPFGSNSPLTPRSQALPGNAMPAGSACIPSNALPALRTTSRSTGGKHPLA